MTKTRIIGFTAMGVCVLGYAGMGLFILLAKLGHVGTGVAVAGALASGTVGEIGLWVGAGCLGLTIFKKRKALFDRIFRRGARNESAPAGDAPAVEAKPGV